MAQDASASSIGTHLAPVYAAHRSRTAIAVHDEAAFRHLLGIERRRADFSGRVVLLVLVSLRGSAPGRSQRLTAQTANRIFAGLGSSVREVDFVGWLRDRHVAAAALVQRGRPQTAAIAARIANTLKKEFGDTYTGVRLRAVPLGQHALGIAE
jgi:hypothetical protein